MVFSDQHGVGGAVGDFANFGGLVIYFGLRIRSACVIPRDGI